MAVVIHAIQIAKAKQQLPISAFFIDTNILIDYEDPFSRNRGDYLKMTQTMIESVNYFKSSGCRSFSTISVALEYYKHIQIGFYKTYLDKEQFDSDDFKHQRNHNIDFMQVWDIQLKKFNKIFRKNFPLFDYRYQNEMILKDFKGSQVDFGDHLLYTTVRNCDRDLRCVFTNDNDFYSYPDDLYILTTNNKMIVQADKDEKLYK